MSNKVVAISGNIGVGKTTLINRLVEKFGWVPLYESVEDNPFLDDFYKDPKRYSFTLQVYFLTVRIKEYFKAIEKNRDNVVILDRCIYEDINIFSENLFLNNKMTEKEYKAYQDMSRMVCDLLNERKQIDNIFYLRNTNVDSIMSRISQRGRDCESAISKEYISDLNKLYEDWSHRDNRIKTLDITGVDLMVGNNFDSIVETIMSSIS